MFSVCETTNWETFPFSVHLSYIYCYSTANDVKLYWTKGFKVQPVQDICTPKSSRHFASRNIVTFLMLFQQSSISRHKTWPMTRWPLPWPLWLTSLATMTLLMTVWRKSFSPATLGEKREMFSCLWRMASSNASLEFTRDRQHTNGKRRREEEKTRRRVATESERSVNMSRREMDDREREKENTKRWYKYRDRDIKPCC